MSLDLKSLQREFPVSDAPGLSTLDPRFQDVAAMVQNGKYAEAAAAAQGIIEEDILDIRLLGYFFFGVFLEQGPKSLGPCFESMSHLFNEQWAAVGPAKKKDRLTNTTFVWFFKTLTRKVKMHETKKDKLWKRWSQNTTSEEMDVGLEQIQKFRRAFAQAVENPKALDQVSNLMSWMKDFQNLVYSEEKAKEPEAPPPEETPAEEQPAAAAGAAPVAAAIPGGVAMIPGGVLIEGGYQMLMLKKKLEAFERLIDKGELAKAALIASDVGAVLNAFNPREYFPKFFSNYFSILSKHITELAGFWEQKNSMAWGAMEQLYKVDIDRFVEI